MSDSTEEFYDFVVEVAGALDGNWTVSAPQVGRNDLRITSATGEALYLLDGDATHRRTDNGKVIVSAHFGELQTTVVTYHHHVDPITISQSRGPAVTAAAIRTKILPRYQEILAKVAPIAAKNAAAARRAQARLDDLATALGGQVQGRHADDPERDRVAAGNITAVPDATSTEFHINVSAAQTSQFASYLRQFFAPTEESVSGVDVVAETRARTFSADITESGSAVGLALDVGDRGATGLDL